VVPAWRHDQGPTAGWDMLVQILGHHLVGAGR
jgi:hypothetical protein